MRFLTTVSVTCLILVGVGLAQEQPNPGRFRVRRPQVQPAESSQVPMAPPGENIYGPEHQQQPQTQPQPQVQVPTPASQPQPAVTPTPLPENLPSPVPPQVVYRNGLLTVDAPNSTLAAVIAAIRNKTGIQFEGLEGGATERVVLSMGPAPEGEVLAAILGGSKYDYVAIDRSDTPGIVQRVLLTPRGGPSAATAGTQPPISSSAALDDDEGDEPDPDVARSPQDTPARPPLVQAQPQPAPQNIPPSPPQNIPQPQVNQQPQVSPQTGQSAPNPEQLLEELKRLQEQRQQQNPPDAPHKQPPQ